MRLYRRSKSGNWHVAFTAPDGRRIRESTGTCDQREAQEYADRLKAETWRVYKLGDRPQRTWQEAVLRFLKETSLKRSHERDKGKLQWLDPYLGHLRLEQITADLVAKIRDDILDGKSPCGGSSPANANRYLALIRCILRKASREWDWIDKTPYVRLLRETGREGQSFRWLTRERADCLLARLKPQKHTYDMARFTLATGLRETNVTGLTWDRVDLSRRVAWVEAVQSKTCRAISVPLNDTAIAVLRRWRFRHERHVFICRGKPVARANSEAWRNALEAEGLKPYKGRHPANFRWHDLRHTWASWHVMGGTPLEVLQRLGGWSTLDMVMRYAHLAPGHIAAFAGNCDTKLAQNYGSK